MTRDWAAARTLVARASLAAALLVVAWATLAPPGAMSPGAMSPGAMPDPDAPRACLSCGASRFTDAAANVFLFIPLGAALVLCGAGVARAALIGLLVTAAIELSQFAGFPPGRVATLSDLLCNAAGALIGATIAQRRGALLSPRPAHAVTLALSWAAVAAAMLIATAWLVGDPHPVQSSSSASSSPLPRRSALPFTPGYGWFEGTVAHAVIDGAEFVQASNGPMIIETAARSRYSATMSATGRDRRSSAVPMLFVHREADTLPVLMIAQRGDAFVLRGDSRAARLGFAAPDLTVPRTLDPWASKGGAADQRRSVVLAARVSPRALSLAIDEGRSHRSVELLRTATVTWALVQSLVPVGTRHGAIITGVWLALLIAPLGYWGWLSGGRRAFVVCVGAVLVALSLWTGVKAFGIAYPPPIEMGAMLAGLFIGCALGRISFAGNR